MSLTNFWLPVLVEKANTGWTVVFFLMNPCFYYYGDDVTSYAGLVQPLAY